MKQFFIKILVGVIDGLSSACVILIILKEIEAIKISYLQAWMPLIIAIILVIIKVILEDEE